MWSVATPALTILSINTEWFWDELPPHEDLVAIGPRGNPPTSKEVELEAFALATLIREHDADIVGLVEVEGEAVVHRLLPYLGEGWQVVFVPGRDTYTGLDVALVTRMAVITQTATSFPDIEGTFGGTRSDPPRYWVWA